MQNLLEELKKLLEQDERFVVEGKLLKNKIIESALKLDVDLIRLLLKSETIKTHFFQEVDGVLVFDKIKFQKFISNKAFLPDSYTSFKNKIGLVTENEEYLSESKEAVLAWPYKDCVLEGGMEKEDEKRNEIFYNEILAPDEIDRLLEPKVLTNFKRIDKDGEHKVTEINKNDNLIIRGNNLLALHSLKKRYAGRIKLIYIDPPYNQEGSVFYNDSFKHSSWLIFMKNRLDVAWQLLKRNGVIFIQIGEEEISYLKILCDELFTRDNFISIVARVAKTASNKGTYFAPSIDFILCYARDINALPPFFDKVDESLYKKVETEGSRKGEKYRDDVALYQSSLDIRPNQRYFIKCPDGSLVIPPGITLPNEKLDGAKILPDKNDGVWRWAVDSYKEKKYLLVFKRTKRSPLLNEEGKQAKWNIYTKSYLNDRKETGTLPRNYLDQFINRKGADYIKTLDVDFNYPKPVELIQYLIEIVGVGKDEIILDFFAGSGTTAEAVIRINKNDKGHRKFILCEQIDYIEDTTIKRVRKIIEDNYFIYCELMKLNEKYIDEIKKAKTTKQLVDIWKTMKETAFLSYKVDVKKFDLPAATSTTQAGESVNDFERLSIENQKEFLIECLDKNQLYVNLSEIDDSEYEISKEDKELNKQFYEVNKI